MTSWPGQPAPPKRRQEIEPLVYLTDEEKQEKIFKVCEVLEGVVMSNALAILRDCEVWIASTARVSSAFAVSPGEKKNRDGCDCEFWEKHHPPAYYGCACAKCR